MKSDETDSLIERKSEKSINKNIQEVFLSVIHNIGFKRRSIYEKGKLFPKAFEITDEHISDLDRRVRKHFGDFDSNSDYEIYFEAEVTFPDLTRCKFLTFEDTVREAGHVKDPSAMTLTWQRLLMEPIASIAVIEVELNTEKPLDTEELGLLEHHLASMEITVAGPEKKWVENVFKDIEPIFEAAIISGIYKPLLLFRNKTIVHYSGILLSSVTYFLSMIFVQRQLGGESKSKLLSDILSKVTVEEKINQLSRALFLQEESIINLALSFGAGLIVMALTMLTCYVFLPKLVPRSVIAVGLAKTRFLQYQNAFRFIVFTLIVSGIVLPILINVMIK